MPLALRFDLPLSRRRSLPSVDPLGLLLRLDAAYRQRRRMDDLTDAQLRDMGLTRQDVESVTVADIVRRG